MSVHRKSYRDKRTGQLKHVDTWTCRFSDHKGCPRLLPAFKDKRASVELDRRLHLLAARVSSGLELDADTMRWLRGLPVRMIERLASWWLLDARLFTVRSLTTQLDEFRGVLQAKDRCPAHVALVVARLRRIFTGCGWTAYQQIDAEKLASWLHQQRGPAKMSVQTSNFYLAACKQFCRWMVESRRAVVNPLVGLHGQNVAVDRRHDRRALSTDEAIRLLDATISGPVVCGMTGQERSLRYRLMMETGLRAHEVATLTKAAFHLDEQPPVVVVEAGYSKHRRRDSLMLRPELATLLRVHLVTKHPAALAFHTPRDRHGQIDALKADLAAAGIPYCVDGRYADLHALRHTFITLLARGGVHPRVAQSLARHSTIGLTMATYTHVDLDQERAALDALPNLSTKAI